jgi:hypothetical protein
MDISLSAIVFVVCWGLMGWVSTSCVWRMKRYEDDGAARAVSRRHATVDYVLSFVGFFALVVIASRIDGRYNVSEGAKVFAIGACVLCVVFASLFERHRTKAKREGKTAQGRSDV